jgi:sec-independent protein translocase protein TatC
MAKKPDGKSKPGKAKSPASQEKNREEISSQESTPEITEQAELPLDSSAPVEKPGPVKDDKPVSEDPEQANDDDTSGETENVEPDEFAAKTSENSAADAADHADEGSPEDHHDEYHDDHYDYHASEHHEYHDEYHDYDDQHGDPSHDDPHAHGGGYYGGGTPDEPDDDLDEGGKKYGGPIKPFLDHLEDFRWMLLKIFASVAIGMVVSLVAAPNIMSLLTKPMEWARDMEYIKLSRGLDKKFVPVRLGNKQITTLKGDALDGLYPGANATFRESIMEIHLVPTNLVALGGRTNQVLTMVAKTDGKIEAPIPEAKYYGVIDPFMGAIKLAIYGGIFISIPFILYFFGDFILPALKNKEKKLIYWVVGGGTFLFLAGAAFCYFILLKITMLVSVSFAHMLGFGADEWRADNLIGFVAKFTIGMGLAFQMPMVILSLVKIGFVDDRGLAKFRSYALIINLILAAMITPTVDPFTMLLVAGPLQLLYEVSLFIARYWRKRDEAAERADEANEQ